MASAIDFCEMAAWNCLPKQFQAETSRAELGLFSFVSDQLFNGYAERGCAITKLFLDRIDSWNANRFPERIC